MPYVGPPVTGMYLDLLAQVHRECRPRTYLEIGMRTGESLALASPETLIIGIDPVPAIWKRVNADAGLFFETSDDFFEQRDVRALLGGRPIDLAFIDGMHLFEYALRDFRNVEHNAAPGSVILVHDCLPENAAMASREQTTSMWTGDTWKLVCCLSELRPDLRISTIAVGPSGLAVISNLDPESTVLDERYDEAIERFRPLEFDHVDGRHQDVLRVVPNTQTVISELIPHWPAEPGREPARLRYPRSWPALRYAAPRAVRGRIRQGKRMLTRHSRAR